MASDTKIIIKTSNGNKVYKISPSGGKFICYRTSSSFTSNWDHFGKASSYDDALSLVKNDASSYGSIKNIDIR